MVNRNRGDIMICCCALAGTAACKTCANNPSGSNFGGSFTTDTGTGVYKTKTKNIDESLKIISDLNKHINDLREDNKLLREKIYYLQEDSNEDKDKIGMTREEYINAHPQSLQNYSEPKFICPKCGKNSVCMDNSLVLATYPPQHRFECREEYGGCGEYVESL